jgi:hypothetical protein
MNYDALQDSYWRTQIERVEERRIRITSRPSLVKGALSQVTRPPSEMGIVFLWL